MDRMDGREEWLTASEIATFVYCERKFHYSVSPPPGYVESERSIMRKSRGALFHQKKELRARLKYAVWPALLLLGIISLILAVAVWIY